MTAERRRSGFGVGFSKEVDSILMAAQLGHLYPDEVRENLRIAGMVLDREAEMPTLDFEKLVDHVGLDADEGSYNTDTEGDVDDT